MEIDEMINNKRWHKDYERDKVSNHIMKDTAPDMSALNNQYAPVIDGILTDYKLDDGYALFQEDGHDFMTFRASSCGQACDKYQSTQDGDFIIIQLDSVAKECGSAGYGSAGMSNARYSDKEKKSKMKKSTLEVRTPLGQIILSDDINIPHFWSNGNNEYDHPPLAVEDNVELSVLVRITEPTSMGNPAGYYRAWVVSHIEDRNEQHYYKNTPIVGEGVKLEYDYESGDLQDVIYHTEDALREMCIEWQSYVDSARNYIENKRGRGLKPEMLLENSWVYDETEGDYYSASAKKSMFKTNFKKSDIKRTIIKSKTKKSIDSILNGDDEFKYQMLGRWKSDLDYYFGYGNRNESILWSHSLTEQIDNMNRVYDSLEIKPDWLTKEMIQSYLERE